MLLSSMLESHLRRRSLFGLSAAVLASAQVGSLAAPARAAAPAILKPTPADRFVDYGTNAEMRWDSVQRWRYLTAQERLFVRNHTATPRIDAATYRLRIFGDGLVDPRGVSLGLDDLRRRFAPVEITTVLECTGNGRGFFTSQQGEEVSGTSWGLGAVGTVTWRGVRLRDVLRWAGVRADARSVQATGLDDEYVADEDNHGRVRRPFPVHKALDDAVLAWATDGERLLPDHGFPLRLVLPGWIGIANIKWLGSLQVSRTELTSPWNTLWYNVDGPLAVNPVRSAWELPWEAEIDRRREVVLTGRSWSGAAPIDHVDVSTDGGSTWTRARLHPAPGHAGRHGRRPQGHGWSPWSVRWRHPRPGTHELLARATDRRGRTQPDVAAWNSNGYFFDAVVRHPVTVA